MDLIIPELSLIVLIGPSGSGKSTFARNHFKSTEVISSDFCRSLISDDPNDQSVSNDAFNLVHNIAEKRLSTAHLTVIDATNVQLETRKPLIEIARKYHAIPVAILFDLPESICQERNRTREDRQIPGGAVHRQTDQMHRSLHGLKKEGFRYVYIFNNLEQVQNAEISRQPLWTNRRNDHGPFDIIGDLHGCCGELEDLLSYLGYDYNEITETDVYNRSYFHPDGRKTIFLGDLVDRGPRIIDTVQLVRNMVLAGNGLAVPGNHDTKLVKKLKGSNVHINHGLEKTLDELNSLPPALRESIKNEICEFLEKLISHYVLDDGKLVVAHAGMKPEMQGRASSKVRDFALFGDTTGETDEFGLPIRFDWATTYSGKAKVVYGHTPVMKPEWLNNTINIDTGCVFGGQLTALRYPEMELISIPSKRIYSEPVRPLNTHNETELSAQQAQDEILDIKDILGKHSIETRLISHISIPESNSATALEIMSRFIINPKWLIYLPPTMSPSESSNETDYLEFPKEAFNYYQKNSVQQVICEKKHMGSRLVAVICRNKDTVIRRFGIQNEGCGVLYTRTGRRFFNDQIIEEDLISQMQNALESSGFWDEFKTDWVCLDCELMPWSVKAQELIQSQYASVGVAAQSSIRESIQNLHEALKNGLPVDDLLMNYQNRMENINKYINAYRAYCWNVNSIQDIRLAPFHILASENSVHCDKNHVWHMQQISCIIQAASASSSLCTTPYQVINLNDPESWEKGISWWKELTGAGGEGMVVKPLDFITKSGNKLLQPAIKCRGREYLRIIYGAEYSTPLHLEELRHRNLAAKRSLALREFALGIEGLERFVDRQPLKLIHECAFGVLALESEPIDPRL